MNISISDNVSNDSFAISQTILNVSKELGLSQSQLGEILGISQPSVSSLLKGELPIAKDSKTFELCVLLVQFYVSLDSLISESETQQKWLNTLNAELGDKPINLLKKLEGFINVKNYLDNYRGAI